MDTNALFLLAARRKLRFESSKGNLSVEQLFDLDLENGVKNFNLNDIAVGLNGELKAIGEEVSFVKKPTQTGKKKAELKAKFDIVKTVIDIKVEAREAAENDKELADLEQRLMEVVNQKENEALVSKPLKEARAMLKDIQAKRRQNAEA